MMDAVLEELYAIKEKIARENGYDISRISASAAKRVAELERAGYKFKHIPAPPPGPLTRQARQTQIHAANRRSPSLRKLSRAASPRAVRATPKAVSI